MTNSYEAEQEFIRELLALQYGESAQKKLVSLSDNVSWAKGWPQKKSSFWNAEAFLWEHKIDASTRQEITAILKKYCHRTNNLDLGCGSYSYVPSAVGLDCSEKMLQFNEQIGNAVCLDIDQNPLLPFADGQFDSISAVFFCNYVQKLEPLCLELKRVLSSNGSIVIIQSSIGLNSWQRQWQVHNWDSDTWKTFFQRQGFHVRSQVHEKFTAFILSSLTLL